MEPRRSRRHIKPVPPSLADMDGDVILHMCELVCSPLGDSFTLVPRMSETCKRLHALLRPMLHELRPAVRAISALEALGCPRWTLRERCLRLSIALREDEAFCYANDAFFMQNVFTRVHGPSFRMQEKAERLLATLLPHRAFHHLAALRIMGDVPGYVGFGFFRYVSGNVAHDDPKNYHKIKNRLAA